MTYQTNDISLRRYMEDIRKTTPISREEEQALFRRARRGDNMARERLVKANMRFVLKVALQYRGCPIPLPDLVSEGCLGLIRAVESFDTSRGIKFISYAVWWMKAYITKAINETGSLIRLPANQCLRVRKALKESTQGKDLDEDVQRLMQTSGRGLSFDAPLAHDSKTTFQEVLRDERAPDVEADLDKGATGEIVRELISELPRARGPGHHRPVRHGPERPAHPARGGHGPQHLPRARAPAARPGAAADPPQRLLREARAPLPGLFPEPSGHRENQGRPRGPPRGLASPVRDPEGPLGANLPA